MSDDVIDIAEDLAVYIRHDWNLSEVIALFDMPFNDLLFKSHSIFRKFFNVNELKLCNLMNVKVGGCPENCSYCAQSSHYKTGVKASKLSTVEDVLLHAENAVKSGAKRLCISASWRDIKDRDVNKIAEIVKAVKERFDIEMCATCGMITKQEHADSLKDAGLDYYNHNIDTSEEYYHNIITTRTYQERLDTIEYVKNSGMKICTGGILGMGESTKDRASMLKTLANLPQHPDSVPLNKLIRIPGTPLEQRPELDNIEFIRTIAVARILMPRAYVRIAAGRTEMSKETHALAFFAGANSIFIGTKLLTTDNPEVDKDANIMKELKLESAN